MENRTQAYATLAFLVITVCSFLNFSFAYADGLSLTGSATATGTVSIALPITDIQIAGSSGSDVPVKLLVSNGTLSISETTGLTFTGGTSGSTLYFSGSVANVNNGLASLTYTRASAGSDTLEISLVEPGEVFFSDNGHLYEYISSTLTWSQAKTAAEALTRYGASGYLATITSSDENSFVTDRLENAGWMGASDSGSEGDWKWVTGPEVGTSFWSGTSGGSTVGGMYANWGSGEPNDHGTGEDCGQYLAGGSGRWNDLPCSGTTLAGYVAEFGAPGDLPTVTAKNVSITTVASPSLSSLAPSDNATGVATDVDFVLQFNTAMQKGTGSILIKKVSDDSTVQTIDVTSGAVTGEGTTSITIDVPEDLDESTAYYVIVPNTALENTGGTSYTGISSSTTWNFTTGDFTAPIFSAITATTTGATSTISWTTNELASSKVTYGLTSAYSTTTTETDTAPRVTSHQYVLSNLLSCTTYHYALISADASANSATSTDQTFLTTGCAGGATSSAATSTSITASSGGTTSLAQGSTTLGVTAPSNFTDDALSVVIQVKAMLSSTVLGSIGRPSQLPESVGTTVFDVTAIINGTTVLDSFDAPVTISYTYTDAEVANLVEASLWLYHYHNGAWQALDSCTLDTDANTISCTTESFSIFGLFGSTPSISNIASAGLPWCSGPLAPGWNASLPDGGCGTTAIATAIHAISSSGALNEHSKPAPQTMEPVSSCPMQGFNRTLRYGVTGEDVRRLQQLMNCLGFTLAESGPGAPGEETDYFGVITHAAVERFQATYAEDVLFPINLTTPTGIFARMTQAKAGALAQNY